MIMPDDHKPYIDLYFLRAKEILQKEGLNPIVRAKVFIRKVKDGSNQVYGINEAVDIIDRYSNLFKNGGKVYALAEGSEYYSKETIMILEGRIQDFIDLETMYLGVISYNTTMKNDSRHVDIDKVKTNAKEIVDVVEGRPITYMGPRHWHYIYDYDITEAALSGGFTNCSTYNGSREKVVGTIPHALENIYAWKYGKENAVLTSTLAFDRHMNIDIPRIALVDYNNREITDSLVCAYVLKDRLSGVRVDTCGENHMEDIGAGPDELAITSGVSVRGVYQLRKKLNEVGFKNIKITLSSGFGDIEKVKSFIEAEKYFGVKLFDSLGVGGLFESRMATMDIFEVGENLNRMKLISKEGREINDPSIPSELKEVKI